MVTEMLYEVLRTYLRVPDGTHVDHISMGGMYGVHNTRLKARARAPDLVLPPRETPRRYTTRLLG